MAALLSLTAKAFSQSAKASLSSSNNANISISNSDWNYALIAIFQGGKTAEIKKSVVEQLGKPTDKENGLSVWLSQGLYTVTLRPEKLVVDLDKKNATASLIKKFEKMGEHISDIISTTK
ncbi:MAG: hypothetical protein NVSMB24_32710 [Mucilaginibacter sp.]